ncbi:PREDICTED: uncharacterized protein LOC105455209 [Wasmannia auropunctata]|uniref:uncharacterized protein LOC105455209 n=1 Tax=Wasmannia auropunctata TaxID=64793 RepID=UPI0005EF1CBE|nr:PREDICTED: uncharacterized protein LOC105455209 [Wasmannia auropunctata]
MSSGGINFHGNRVPIRLRCFVADAPARAFILNHRNHMSCRPCSKCKVSGTLYEGRNVFNGINHSPRTDEEYTRCLDEDHHRGNSSLATLPMSMVSQVPFEYMHLSLHYKNLFFEVRICMVQPLNLIMYMVFFILPTMKYCRKPGLPLQQFFNRMTEIDIHRTVDDHNMNSSIHVIPLSNSDINCRQYRKIQFNGISLSIEARDNCCILNDGSIGIIFSIDMNNNCYRLGIKKFLQIQDFYDIGMLSSALQIYKCSILSNEISYIHSRRSSCKVL